MKASPLKQRLAYPLLAGVCLGLSLVVGWTPYGQRINHIFYDLYFRQRGAQQPNENIVIVGIDDVTLRENGPWPLDRARLAQGIRAIRDAQPSLIALDILLTDSKSRAGGEAESADMELRRAIGGEPAGVAPAGAPGSAMEAPPPAAPIPDLPGVAVLKPFLHTPVVLAAALETGGGHWLNPLPTFALSATAVGHVHADPDGDGVSRQVLLEKQGDGERHWALALECFRIWLWSNFKPITETDDGLELESASGKVTIPATRRDERALLINYVGDNGTFPQVSFASIGKDPSVADPSVAEKLRGKIVLIGETAQASGDRVFTPLSAGIGMAGVEIHANILNTLLDGAYLQRASESKAALGMLAIIAATLWGLARLQGIPQTAWLMGLAAFVLAAPYGRFLEGEVWPAFSLLTSFGTALVAGEAFQLLVARKSVEESEEKRKQSQRRFEMAAHEMRTPLASIQASSELLANYRLDDARRGQMIQLLHEESQRLGRLVERFLSVERLSAGELELRRAPMRLSPWLATLVERLRPVADRKGVRLIFDESHSSAPESMKDEIEIEADVELLEFAVSNLITNAVKYSPAGTEVKVSCEPSGQNAAIQVADCGPGMAVEESRRVFDRFYRTDSAERSENPGFGLGLAIAREIARHHGGDIRIETQPGSGSCFTILLPTKIPTNKPKAVPR
jgi:signal transduction histidine kinase